MPVIHKHKLIFQHLPKTGGLAVLDALGGEAGGHQHMMHYQKMKLEGYRSFTIIRDPVERFRSAYAMYVNPPKEIRENKLLISTREKYKDFFQGDINDHITIDNLQMLANDTDAFHFWSVVNFFGSHRGNEMHVGPLRDILENGGLAFSNPDHILLYEDLDRDFKLLCKFLNIDAKPLRRINSTKEKPPLTEQSIGTLLHYFYFDHQILGNLYQKFHISRSINPRIEI